MKIEYGRHYVDRDDIRLVEQVLKHHSLTQGNFIKYFEDAIREYVGSKYAIAVSSCTAGLHLSQLAIDMKSGYKSIIPAITFVATANSVKYCNGDVDFVDINKNDINLSIEDLAVKIEKFNNIRSIVPVHFAGYPADMEKISKLNNLKNIKIIEDAAHAFGSRYKSGKLVGSCSFSDMCVFSFHPVKSITSGEGGVITTNDKTLYKKLLTLRNHGLDRDINFRNKKYGYTKNKKNQWYYELSTLGYNYRITDIQSALGISQLNKTDRFLKRRRSITKKYYKELGKLNNIKCCHDYKLIDKSACHLFVIRINFKKIKKSRMTIMDNLKKRGIITQVHYIPIYLQPFYKIKNYKSNFSNSLNYYEECLSIPIFFGLKNEQQDYIIKALKTEVLEG